MASRRTGALLAFELRISFRGNDAGIGDEDVERAVGAVLEGEGVETGVLSVTFYSSQQMRALNRRVFGRDRATDVIAFPMTHEDTVAGDIYVCPGAARKSARRLKISVCEELLRLVIHGTLHVLGYEHPEGAKRSSSAMWKLQEQYLREISSDAGA
ncbi:MAG: rRNA maturation RNase YbeY [Gemmatimonadetes bacterium]|nr:rRNA maturation RNase YbeY [Gemmatimonadota bacterium]